MAWAFASFSNLLLRRGRRLVVLGLLDHVEEVRVDGAQLLLHGLGLRLLLLLRFAGLALGLVPSASEVALPQIQILLLLRLALEHGADGRLLVVLRGGEGIADLHESNGTLDVTHRQQSARRSIVGNGRQSTVPDLMSIRNFVLAVEVVPHIYNTVHARDEEDAGTSRTPTTGGQVGRVVLRRHDRRLEVLHPDAGGPVADRHEKFCVRLVPMDRINGAVVLAVVLVVDRNTIILLPVSQIDRQYYTLLRTDHIFCGYLLVVVHGTSTQHGSVFARRQL